MKVALVLCPGWYPFAPALGPALLKAFLKERGHEAFTLDLGPMLLKHVSEGLRQRLRQADTAIFLDRERVLGLFQEYSGMIDAAVNTILDSGAQVVGFTIYYSTWHFSLEMARRLKAKNPAIGVVLGGPEGVRFNIGIPINDHRFELEAVDAIVPGEGEIPLLNLLGGWKNGAFTPCPGAFVRRNGGFVWSGEAPAITDLNSLPFPDFAEFNAQDYLNCDQLVTYFSRGCFKKCVFCDVEVYWKGWRNRSGSRVMGEVKHLLSVYPGVRNFIFCDSIMNANMKELGVFCDLIMEEKKGGFPEISWKGYAVIRGDMTSGFCRKLKSAGCSELWFGIESGSQRVLNSMKKGYHVATMDAVLRAAHEAGIRTMALLMVGFPTETLEDFEETLNFLRRNASCITQIWPSESFTYIANQTYLDKHAVDLYGVDPETMHPDFWESQNGRNNYLERLRRFEALCKCAVENGVDMCSAPENVRNNMQEKVKNYEHFQSKKAAQVEGRAGREAR